MLSIPIESWESCASVGVRNVFVGDDAAEQWNFQANGDNILANIYVKKIWSTVRHTIHYKYVEIEYT